MDGEELTEQETALYHRQIRVWGADTQRSFARTLAGVGSLTLLDDRPVTEEALSANFLIPPEEGVYGGKSLAELCCDSLKEFNPMVHVSVEKGDLSSSGAEFLHKFDVVVVSCCPLSTKKLIYEKCRKLSKRVAFYTVGCRDSSGEIFVDLQEYKCIEGEETSERELKHPSFQEAISVPWITLPKKVSKLYFAMRVIAVFEEAEGHKPGEICIEDLPNVLKLEKELCEQQIGDGHTRISSSLCYHLRNPWTGGDRSDIGQARSPQEFILLRCYGWQRRYKGRITH